MAKSHSTGGSSHVASTKSAAKHGAVTFNYRSAHGVHGRVVGVTKGGSKNDPMEAVMPAKSARHPGEKLPIHRRASKLHKA